jgi:maltokinase
MYACGTVPIMAIHVSHGDPLASWDLDGSHAVVVRRSDYGLELEPAVRGDAGWRRAAAGDGTAAALMAALADTVPADTVPADTVPGDQVPAGQARAGDGFRVRVMTPLPQCGRGERAIMVDQTNESVIVAERLVVKWFPRPSAVPHPAPGLLEHLALVGFRRMPTPYAALWSSASGGEALIALVTGYLPFAQDGWDWCVEDVLAEWDYGQRAMFPGQLGLLAADLHAALATPSEVFPAPVGVAGPEEIEAWGKQAAEMIDAAVAALPGADGEWLRERAGDLHEDARRPVIGQTPVLPIHGDLHVGQVLRWRGGLAVTDFEPNPAVPADGAPQPPARDVAQLMTSLAHVAAIADKRTGWQRTGAAHAFAARAGEEFLYAYKSRLAGHGKASILDERLLRGFAVEQEAREIVYAARFLPRWAYAPMSVLRSWYPEQN